MKPSKDPKQSPQTTFPKAGNHECSLPGHRGVWGFHLDVTGEHKNSFPYYLSHSTHLRTKCLSSLPGSFLGLSESLCAGNRSSAKHTLIIKLCASSGEAEVRSTSSTLQICSFFPLNTPCPPRSPQNPHTRVTCVHLPVRVSFLAALCFL